MYCSLNFLYCLNCRVLLSLGFPANEAFREKMRKCSFVFRKLFREISHFIAKIIVAKNAKTKRNFSFPLKNLLINFSTFLRNRLKLDFAKIAKNFAFFASERNEKKCEIFSKLFFFARNPNCPPSVLVLYCNPGSLVLCCPPGIPVLFSVQYCHLYNKCTVLFCTFPLVYLYCSNCTVLSPS